MVVVVAAVVVVVTIIVMVARVPLGPPASANRVSVKYPFWILHPVCKP